jgi:Cu(I)/Ag(I) efflux system protein CusF
MKKILSALAAAMLAAMPLVADAADAAGGHGPAQHGVTATATTARAVRHHATGIVRSVDAGKGTVMIAHEPIASLGWPAMTMSFQVRDPRLLGKLRTGSAVEFDFEQTDAGYLVTAIK